MTPAASPPTTMANANPPNASPRPQTRLGQTIFGELDLFRLDTGGLDGFGLGRRDACRRESQPQPLRERGAGFRGVDIGRAGVALDRCRGRRGRASRRIARRAVGAASSSYAGHLAWTPGQATRCGPDREMHAARRARTGPRSCAVGPIRSAAMTRQCARPDCAEHATSTFGYDYRESRVWLVDLTEEPHPLDLRHVPPPRRTP